MKIERQTSNVKRETSNVKREISNIQYPISLLLVACFLLLTACGPAQPKGEVIVYVAAPLSGFQANGGQTVLGGARLMAERLNQAGGLLGYRVRVVGIDDESDSDVAVEVAQQIKEALERVDRN